MPIKDVAIPIIFPDYLITVETPEEDVGGLIAIHATKQKMPYLGHAGILFIDGERGVTKYFEYGRYDPQAKGLVRKLTISDVKMADNGRPMSQSLKKVLSEISLKSGQGGKIRGAYIELEAGAFGKMLQYATTRMKANSNANRTAYSITSNSCLHFMKSVAEAGGANMPPVATVFSPPTAYVKLLRLFQNDLDFDSPVTMSVKDIDLQ